MSVNKLKNAWINNDTTNLDGTYNKVSLLNEGKTELKGDSLVNTKLAINKNIDSANDYKLDVNGNVNFSGNLYKNGALFQSGITLAQVQSNQNNFTNNFTVNNISETGSNITFNSRAIIFNTPNTDDFSNGLQIKDASGRVYFSTFPQDLNTAIINPNSATGYMYINQNTVFQSGITLQTNGGVGGILQVGTPYGVGTIYVNSGTIEVDSSSANNKLKVNVIDAYNPSTVSSIYPTITNTINIGNSANTYNVNMYGIWNVLGTIKSNNLTITPTQLGYLSNLTSDIQTQINSKLGTTITQNLTANSLTITPAQLGYLSNLTSDIQTQINSKLGTTITQNLTANSLTITPAQLGYLSGTTSSIQTQLNSKLGTTITQNITANSLIITPEQLCFLNRVLKTPSVNATLIPKTAISNYTDFLQYNIATSITATYTFTSNPVFNNDSIPSLCIDNYNVPRFVETGANSDVTGTITFLSDPVFNSDAIPMTSINNLSATLSNYQAISYDSGTTTTTITSNTIITSNLQIGSTLSSANGTILMNGNVSINNDTFIKNNTIKLGSHSQLSGTTTLTTPLSEYYNLTTTSNGIVNLPIITSNIIGSELTFTKINATNTYTINAGTGNFFRFLGSSSSATQTSITMSFNFTVLKIVATQGGIWDVLISNNSSKVNTSLITGATTLSFPYFENYSIAGANTTAFAITLPTASSSLLGQRISFRRVNAIQTPITVSPSIYPLTSNTLGTSLMAGTQYNSEIVCLANSATPTYAWYIIRQN